MPSRLAHISATRGLRIAGALLVCALGLSASSCSSESRAADTKAEQKGEAPGKATAELLQTMSLLAGDVHGSEALEVWKRNLETGTHSIDDYIESLVQSAKVGSKVAPNLIFGANLNVLNYYALPLLFTLNRVEREGKDIYYLRKPCTAEEAQEVHPWWDMDTSVLVCPDSYRPERWEVAVDEHDYRSRMPLSCDSQVGSPEKENKPLCGCGPNLLRCLRDYDQYSEMHRSITAEVRDTTAYIVNNNKALSQLFTANETMRNQDVEWLYQRSSIGALKDAAGIDDRLRKLRRWPKDAHWGRREEVVTGQHAGLLTSVQMLTLLPDRRQRQRGYYEMMWCDGRDSFGATTEKIFEINKESANLAFTHDSWEVLANTPVCTNCHARLDYGFQYFMGYLDARAATHFVPAQARSGKGPMYGNDINDPRFEAELSPRSFALHAVEQPEFAQCMAGHISQYVLGSEVPAEEHQKVFDAFAKSGTFRDALRVALQRFAALYPRERFVTRREAQGPAASTPASTADDAPVRFSAAMQGLLETHCNDCHSDKSVAFDELANSYGKAVYFESGELPRRLVVRMLDQVAYGGMPKGKAIAATDREALTLGLINALWSDADKRKSASDYFIGQMRALPSYHFDVSLETLREHSGMGGSDDALQWGSIERTVMEDQSIVTPGYLATMLLDSLNSCSDLAQADEDIDDCLSSTFRLDRLIRWPR